MKTPTLLLGIALATPAHAGVIDTSQIWTSGGVTYRFIDQDGNAQTLGGTPVTVVTVGFDPMPFTEWRSPDPGPPQDPPGPPQDPPPVDPPWVRPPCHPDDPPPPHTNPDAPEPGTLALIGGGLITMASLRRR